MNKEQISMALDAIDDAIKNRHLSQRPMDRGLDIARMIIESRLKEVA